MRDWSALVHRHLASVRVDERRRREISAELAAHLEDAYDAALRSGCAEAEAMARAMERVPDWGALAVAVERSADEDSTMTRQAITVLLPGTTMLLAAATGMSLAISSTPADRWLDPRWQVHALAAVAGLYALSRGVRGLHLDINIINMTLVLLVVPGSALLLGWLPFARRSARLDAQ